MNGSLVENLLGLTALGAEWVLWLLILLSILSLAIMLERCVYFLGIKENFSQFNEKLIPLLTNKSIPEAIKLCENSHSLEKRTALVGLRQIQGGHRMVEGAVEGFLGAERAQLDRGLVILGTLGNNAPFIGLFGTVIGIIKAFHDLSMNPEGGPAVVMAGISEALVATAVGLMVAIPAVVAFNLFTKTIKRKMANAQSIGKTIASFSHNS